MRRMLQHLRPLLEDGCSSQLRNISRSTQPSAAGARPQMPQRHPRPAPSAEPSATAAAAPAAEGSAASAAESSTAAGGGAKGAAPAASAAAPAAEAATAAELEAAQQQREAAQAVTSSMLFPWERRQFSEDNKGLRTWEKVYWGVFVTAISALLFSRIVKPTPKAEPEVDDGKEERKAEMARAILAGNASFINGNADVFEGLSPAEIQEYVANATHGATTSDPFEGMSPEEINDYIEKHGVPAGA